jgi:uncharacterized membrane protein
LTLPFQLAWEAPGRDIVIGAAGALALGALLLRLGPKDRWVRGLRLAALALTALCLARPAIVRLRTEVKRPKVAVWLDGSTWMGVEEDGRSRQASALSWLGAARKQLEAKADVSYFRLGDRLDRREFEKLGEKPNGGLRLESALDARGEKFDEVWLLSDGVGDASEDLEGALARFTAPVKAVGVGRARRSHGVTLVSARAPDFVFLHETFPLGVEWQATGLAGRTVRLRLSRGSELVSEQIERVQTAQQTFASTFTVRAEALGGLEYRLELQPLGGPAEPPAREDVRVEAIRQKLRILYLCGRPSFEYSTMREFIKSDPANELVSFVILRNQENIAPVPENELSLIPFPANEIFVQSLFDFDLFIFQDFAFWRFGLPMAYLASVRQFVARGGGLLVIGGENSFGGGQYKGTPIDELLPAGLPSEGAPFEPGLFRAAPRDLRHPLARFEGGPGWSELPPLDGHHRFGAPKPGASLVAAAPDGSPVFATREFGKGRVFLSSSPSTWRWKIGAGLDWKVGSFYERFWGRAFDYLTGSLDMKKVRFAKSSPKQPRPIATLHVFDEAFRPLSGAGVEVEILQRLEGNRWEPVPAHETGPGVYQAELAAGRRRLKAIVKNQGRPWGEAETDFAWTPPALQFAPMDDTLLRKIAEKTRGVYARLGEADPRAWVDALPEPVPVTTAASRTAVWASPAWLGAIGALLIAEWWLRRRRGYR